MWALANRTPYAAERNWIRDKNGSHWWLVAVRATFDIRPAGRLLLCDEQSPPVLAPEYVGTPGISSLRCDSDLLEPKTTTDLLVLGSAHPATGKPTSAVAVTFRAGGQIDKRLVVYGERVYLDRWRTTTAPIPFSSRPIQYELAFGGMDCSDLDPRNHGSDQRNPVGRGFAVRLERLVDKPAHAIEYQDGHPERDGPAGLGPIDRSWLPRRRLAGTYDAAWERARKPLLPDDYDPTFAQSAPNDQRPEKPFVGGEPIELSGMTPDGVLRFHIPRVSLHFTTRIAARREQHPSLLATVLIDADANRVSVVWQSALRVSAREADYLDETEIVETRSTI